MKIKCPENLEFVRPDEMAECYDGVDETPGLYEALWACVPKYKSRSPEEMEEPVHGADSISDFWDEFSDYHKMAIVKLEEKFMREIEGLRHG